MTEPYARDTWSRSWSPGPSALGGRRAHARSDLWSVLDRAPGEVPALRAALMAGRVDGSRYFGECACLLGTIAKARGCTLGELGVHFDGVRPAEAWFGPILPGDVPGGASEGAYRAGTAVRWIDEWTRAREVAA